MPTLGIMPAQTPPVERCLHCCRDRWGLSWQITPIALTKAIADPDPAAARRAFDAIMEMTRIDIARIEEARRG
jgi:predicted 3-demethylubiquinone-9 3-methyltransferase (glyoxalase superfamily)